MTAQPISPTADYGQWLTALKDLIRQSRVKAALAVNRELLLLYWRLGQEILQRQAQQGWGAKVVAQLAQDLRGEFPDMRGLSPRNVMYMRSFAETWPDEPFVQQLAAQIPWFHHCLLLDKVKDQKLRVWYIQKTIESGWSRAALEYQIDTQLHLRLGLAQNNFARTLPAPQSELARDLAKDSYAFDFLGLTDQINERSIEKALTMHLRDFLVKLGVGFAFVGSQYKLEIEGDEFYIDLLFYHTRLHCYVVIELKNTEFKFEYTGQLNGYLAVVDDLVRDAAVELLPGATHKDFLLVRQKGSRQVSRQTRHYNLDAVLSVSYRVKSAVATRFRIWATQQLRECLSKRFLLDDERLKKTTPQAATSTGPLRPCLWPVLSNSNHPKNNQEMTA